MAYHGYSRWEDAVVEKERQLRFLDGRYGREYMGMIQESLNVQHKPEERMPDGLLWHALRVACAEGDPVYVSDDVTDIVDKARETFRPEKLIPEDMISPAGFLVFPRPILLNDHPKYGPEAFLPVRAIAWCTVIDSEDNRRGAAWVTFLTHTDDDRDYSAHLPAFQDVEELQRQADKAKIDWDVRKGLYNADRNAVLTAAHVLQMTFGANPWDRDEPLLPVDDIEKGLTSDEIMEQHKARGLQQWLLPQVVWRIAQQVVRQPERPSRPVRRDLKRRGRPDLNVTVIRLRRYREHVEPADEGGRLTVRFIVRGHWRNQWYASIQEHRQIWIAPYVKGPDDGEFKMTERVFEFIR